MPTDRLWYVSVITLGEYRFGLLKSNQRERLERWLNDTEHLYVLLLLRRGNRQYYARLRFAAARSNRNPPYHDLWIAALAEQHSLPVVSRDTDFDSMPGIRRVSW